MSSRIYAALVLLLLVVLFALFWLLAQRTTLSRRYYWHHQTYVFYGYRYSLQAHRLAHQDALNCGVLTCDHRFLHRAAVSGGPPGPKTALHGDFNAEEGPFDIAPFGHKSANLRPGTHPITELQRFPNRVVLCTYSRCHLDFLSTSPMARLRPC
jgi:hypothetical protein